MRLFVLGLGVLSLTGCTVAGAVVGRVARIPSDIVKGTVSYDGQDMEQQFERGDLGGR